METWLPDHVSIQQVSLNGWRQRDTPVTENYWGPLEDLTRRFLDQSPDHVAVVEAYVGYEPDWILKDVVTRMFHFFCNSVMSDGASSEDGRLHLIDVFEYLNGCGHGEEQVADFIGEASSFHQIIVLLTAKSPMPPSGAKVEKEYLAELAQSIDFIAIGAYDGSGVILWKRQSGSNNITSATIP